MTPRETRISDDLRNGPLRLFRNAPEVESAARRAVADYVARNEPRTANDDSGDQLFTLLDMLGLVVPPDEHLPRSH